MRTETAPSIRLEDYTPPSFDIRDVHLFFSLDPDNTRVRSSITVVRRNETALETPLSLDGDELTLISLSLNGKTVPNNSIVEKADGIELHHLPEDKMFKVEIVTELSPASNKKLMGLYQSNGVYCTQCEAEGFRRITYFPDRPDVLSIYTVQIEADRKACPVLLSNGNHVKSGELADGRHFVVWHDPHPKPSYLFAIVGGNLDVYRDKFKTASGRAVDLNIYVETGKAAMAAFAMDSLKRSMTWDEEVYGREYDLNVFNIVAVSDFNMGAMENKGLNIFNDKYVLADPEVATDLDAMHIEAIIAHEYFHNWTGNRITCRDWFQLCLKEGLTVYRDQEFSADQRSRSVQRIQQVRTLKAGQFSEDAGPLAHSVRPEAYKEINNFYTATVYQKGAELVRMLATLVGPEAYRKSTDLYFERHDGEAAVVEDWLKCFEDAAGINLDLYARWYGQAGTPIVEIKDKYDGKNETYSVTFSQTVSATPGQPKKNVVPIPIRFGLMDTNGNPLVVNTNTPLVGNDVFVLDKKETTVKFEGVPAKPVISLLRGFSAPVIVNFKETKQSQLVRARHDTDLYNKWQALNNFTCNEIINLQKPKARKVDQVFIKTLIGISNEDSLDAAFRAQALTLPSAQDIARETGTNINPDAIFDARNRLQKEIGAAFGQSGIELYEKLKQSEQDSESSIGQASIRALKNALLPLLVIAEIDGATGLAHSQFQTADNMTNCLAALNALIHGEAPTEIVDGSLSEFYDRYKNNHLVVDKWFGVQALMPGSNGLSRIRRLTSHDAFSYENPNRARSLLGGFAAGNMTAFHSADGKGYEFYADQIIILDKINPQVAARLLSLMNNWRSMEKQRTELAKAALTRIAKTPALSRDVQEIVDRMLK